MPKIIKNGKEYSGVPIEVVTAWAPTADPVQVKEPLMGNTDISNIGDGTVTGAINELNTGLANTELTASEYVTINSSFTVNSLTVMRLAPHIAMIRYDIAGTIAEGQTVVGAGTNKVKNLSYGAGRVSAASGTYPATCVIFGGAFRIHATKAGTATAGTVIIEI